LRATWRYRPVVEVMTGEGDDGPPRVADDPPPQVVRVL
jgi:hypothetical protein